MNEARAAKGLGEIDGGDEVFSVWKARHQAQVATILSAGGLTGSTSTPSLPQETG